MDLWLGILIIVFSILSGLCVGTWTACLYIGPIVCMSRIITKIRVNYENLRNYYKIKEEYSEVSEQSEIAWQIYNRPTEHI